MSIYLGKNLVSSSNIPATPPNTRVQTIFEQLGSSDPDGAVWERTGTLQPGWYELELAGCGGGAGGMNGGNGGAGGLLRLVFPVPNAAEYGVSVGTPGKGAKGYAVGTSDSVFNPPELPLVQGDGGKCKYYTDVVGNNGTYDGISAKGKLGGADGGEPGLGANSTYYVSGGTVNVNTNSVKGYGGGAAVGIGGGRGGRAPSPGFGSNGVTTGSSGGAGAGYGKAGDGYRSSETDNTGIGRGGGGGGKGYMRVSSGGGVINFEANPGGGGGGGSSSFVVDSISLFAIAGGGGGGASRGSSGEGGYNNITQDGIGEGGAGGTSNPSLAFDGLDGSRGWAKLWRLG